MVFFLLSSQTILIPVPLLFVILYPFNSYNVLLQVPLEDLHWASQQLMEALHIRERYMRVSHQSFPNITSKFFHKKHPKPQGDPSSPSSGNASVLHSSDSVTDVSAVGGDSNRSEIRQPYPSARVIKHEDRQSIAGESCDHSAVLS